MGSVSFPVVLSPVAGSLPEGPLTFILAALAAALLAALAFFIHQLYRRMRFSLGDFCVIVWLTGLAAGLAAKFLPVGAGWLPVAGVSAAAGSRVLMASILGLEHAEETGAEGFWRRAWLQLRMSLLVAACGVFIGAVGAVAVAGRAVHPLLLVGGAVAFVWSAVMLAAIVRTERKAGRRREEAAERQPPADSPVEEPARPEEPGPAAPDESKAP